MPSFVLSRAQHFVANPEQVLLEALPLALWALVDIQSVHDVYQWALKQLAAELQLAQELQSEGPECSRLKQAVLQKRLELGIEKSVDE